MSHLAAALSEEEMKDATSVRVKSKSSKKAAAQHTKDLQLLIFHALGKFLYNKRVHPKTKEVKQLPYQMLADADRRPKLYYKPSEVIEQSMLEPSLFTLYLHQNVPQFFGDVADLADCLEFMSHQDSVTS